MTMPDTLQYDVFLSHSSKDKAAVRLLAERSRTTGSASDFAFESPCGSTTP